MSSNIEVKLDVLNQKDSPALFASSLATRPAASFTGRLFVDSDNPSTGIYRDTGSIWVQVADQGAGTTGTLQQITTNGSSTTVGISTSGNGIGIGTTIPTSNRLDIHSASGINATFNGTGTTNAALQFQLAGVGKWTLQNNYNAANNDFVITDVLNASNRITVTNQGQTFIGANTTSSGLLVVNTATADNHIVVIGANSPSIRIRNTGLSPTLNVGFGISTAVNNFIQGSASGDYCIFNSSTTASPILFGVYDAGLGNTQVAIRISAARNLLVGTSGIDSGEKLQVNGTSNFRGLIVANNATFSGDLLVTTGTTTYINIQTTSAGSFATPLYYGINFKNYANNISGGLFIGDQSTNSAGVIVKIKGSNNSGTVLDLLTFNAFSGGEATFLSSIAIGNTVSAAVAALSTHKVSILINGVQYYLLASNV